MSKAKTSKMTVADRVNKRKRLSELQREIEDLSRRIEAESSLGEIVKLRRLFEEKDNERDRLYKEVMAMNGKNKNKNVDVPFLLKKMTLQERRAKKTKKVEIRPRIIAQTLKLKDLKLKDRKALNLERMYQLKKNEEEEAEKKKVEIPQEVDLDEPDFADLVGVQDKRPNDPSLERMYQMQKNEEEMPQTNVNYDVPKELRSMVIKTLKKKPKPKRSNVSL